MENAKIPIMTVQFYTDLNSRKKRGSDDYDFHANDEYFDWEKMTSHWRRSHWFVESDVHVNMDVGFAHTYVTVRLDKLIDLKGTMSEVAFREIAISLAISMFSGCCREDPSTTFCVAECGFKTMGEEE